MKQTVADPVPVMTPAEALMTVAVLAMDADDCYSFLEMQRLRAMVGLHPLLQNTVHSADRFIGQRFDDLRARGRGALLEEARTVLSPRLRETAYAWAVELVHADGTVTGKEHVFLADLARRFEIPCALARRISAVVAILRRTK